jgi:hypothetical protein
MRKMKKFKKMAKLSVGSAVNYLNKALKIVKKHFPENSAHAIRIESKLSCMMCKNTH